MLIISILNAWLERINAYIKYVYIYICSNVPEMIVTWYVWANLLRLIHECFVKLREIVISGWVMSEFMWFSMSSYSLRPLSPGPGLPPPYLDWLTFAWIGVESFCQDVNFCPNAWIHLPGYFQDAIHQPNVSFSRKTSWRREVGALLADGKTSLSNVLPNPMYIRRMQQTLIGCCGRVGGVRRGLGDIVRHD